MSSHALVRDGDMHLDPCHRFAVGLYDDALEGSGPFQLNVGKVGILRGVGPGRFVPRRNKMSLRRSFDSDNDLLWSPVSVVTSVAVSGDVRPVMQLISIGK